MINNNTSHEPWRLPVERQVIGIPTDGWSYAHHASLGVFQDKLFAMWSNGRHNEDDVGQRVMIAHRENGVWTEPRVLADSVTTGNPFHVLTAAGMNTFGDTVIAYIGSYEYDASQLDENGDRPHKDAYHTNTRLGYVTSADGIRWSGVTWMDLTMIPNHGPRATRSGRLIISGNISFPYTDDPSGRTGYTVTGIYGHSFKGRPVVDDSETIHRVTKENGFSANLICEGAFYQTDDEVLHMLLRSNSGRLWCTESHDDGRTWQSPYPTQFTDDNSKFDVGRLPDGRFYYVGNSVPNQGRRNPLMLCLSDDGVNFDTQVVLCDGEYHKQFEGLYKGGMYAYPHTVVADGCLWIIYSKCKEAIEVACIRLTDLDF